MTARIFYLTAVLFFAVNAVSAQETKSISSDFDFILGKWKVTNKILKQRLADNNEWIEFPASCEIWKILNGMVVIDEFYTERNGEKQIGSSYRIYNKNTKEWTIYWASTAYPDLGLIPQVKGKFNDGVGTFFGEEEFNGEKIKLRFIWKQISKDKLYWDQAYYDKRNNTWETNWIMEFTRE